MREQNFTTNKSKIPEEQSSSPFDKFDSTKEVKPEEPKELDETVIEKVADELHVNLPEVNLPLGLKIVALLTLVGGLGTLGSVFSDIFNTQDFEIKSYLLRLIGGVLFVAISYGIIKRQNWATWLYGLMVILSLIINWPLAILPAVIVVYMYFNRRYLYPSFIDKFFKKTTTDVGSRLK